MIAETLQQLSLKVCQYFLDFLESDFKRQQAPRRRIVLQTESGFRAGMSLAPYPSLQAAVWQKLAKPWDGPEIVLAPRTHMRPLSQPLLLILREQSAGIRPESIHASILRVVNQAKHSLPTAISHPEDWVAGNRQELLDALGTEIVRPLLSYLDTALKGQAYSSVDAVLAAEADLIGALAEPLDEQLPQVLAQFSVTRDTTELMKTCVAMLSVEFVQSTVTAFFQAFVASDALLEFRDLETYTSTAEGLQLYLYVGTIKYGSTTYPLFFLPIETQRDTNSGAYSLRFANQLYANKRAIDFILQELGERQHREWLSPIPERITYLGPDVPILTVLEPLMIKICHVFGFLDKLRLSAGPLAQQHDSNVAISNGLYICAFEKADEALLNDYEEMIAQIRKNEQGAVDLFQAIVEGVITNNPESIAAQVEKQWDETPVETRVVPDTPIPLNEEQQKVIEAVRNDRGRFVVVEGPPGTGKSHTIVAIAADCAFRQKSCLVLSDKPEALEVVHNKLSNAMNEARNSDEFPNPILRLGTEHANFRKLTSSTALTQLAAQVKATSANRQHLEADRDHRRATLRGQISTIIGTLGAIKTRDIAELERLGAQLDTVAGDALSAALDELYHDTRAAPFEAQPNDYSSLQTFLSWYLSTAKPNSRIELANGLAARCVAAELVSRLDVDAIKVCPALTGDSTDVLSKALREADELRLPLVGWLFRRRRLRGLAEECQQATLFRRQLEFPADLGLVRRLVNAARSIAARVSEGRPAGLTFESVYAALSDAEYPVPGLDELYRFVCAVNTGSDGPAFACLIRGHAPEIRAGLWIDAMQYLARRTSMSKAFERAPDLQYVAKKSEVERLNTALMNAEVDSRLVTFMENARTDAKVLAKLIKNRQKFPEDKFESVKQAFPVMIASIREFGEYMPLKEQMLDVLVIDEASQVSVAQAFPALLRARKVVVMGDTNQFSNTKSTNASIALNQKYRAELEAFFRREVSDQAHMLERLSYFDVKRSVLEFCQLCANFTIMLRKHFRSYKELINYSSVTFYRGQLQAIKLRTMPLHECIEFTELEPSDGKVPRNTNPTEGEFILERCMELVKEEFPPTVGVITPFREQQAYLSRLFATHAMATEFRNKLRLKVMTFDSCQGEERNVIFYSMVATLKQDLLNYVFPVQLENAEELVGEKLKMQRLNVGFSRAQEMVWFVLSKPVEQFKGSIGQALRHFQRMLSTPTADASETDPLSPMEQKVLQWIYATSFYQLRQEAIEVRPQFPIGEYLRQLDPTYKHPAWRVDFLVAVNMEGRSIHIVIEYDGFEYHFRKGAEIDVGNHERFLHERDVERQLTLESYGYRFIRINRFNLGRDPVATLSDRLEQLLESASATDATGAVKTVADQADALISRTAKACERCGSIKPLEAFFDKSLADGRGGTGRICMPCKGQDKEALGSFVATRRRRRWRR